MKALLSTPTTILPRRGIKSEHWHVVVGTLAMLGRGDKRANGEMRPKPSNSVVIVRHPSAATYVKRKGTPSLHLQNETKMISVTRRACRRLDLPLFYIGEFDWNPHLRVCDS